MPEMDITTLVGKKVFVRTVTHYYTGRLADVVPGVIHLPEDTGSTSGPWFLHLEEAAWIADTGRFSEALKDGSLNEVEPYPGDCYVNAGAVVDVCEWLHDLPRTVK